MFRRLKEWLSRPSWEDLRTAISLKEEWREQAFESDRKLDVAMNEWATSSASAAEKIAELNGRIEGLSKLNSTLNSDLQYVVDLEKNQHHAHTQEVGQMEREIDRLRGLMMKQVEDSPLERLVVENGGVNMAIRPPHWLIEHMSRGFFEALNDAQNWRAYEIGPVEHKGTRLIVTVCRASGDSPVETVTKCKAMIDRLLSVMPCDALERYEFTINEARALLNPKKKD